MIKKEFILLIPVFDLFSFGASLVVTYVGFGTL